jgi:hypothetical protein
MALLGFRRDHPASGTIHLERGPSSYIVFFCCGVVGVTSTYAERTYFTEVFAAFGSVQNLRRTAYRRCKTELASARHLRNGPPNPRASLFAAIVRGLINSEVISSSADALLAAPLTYCG